MRPPRQTPAGATWLLLHRDGRVPAEREAGRGPDRGHREHDLERVGAKDEAGVVAQPDPLGEGLAELCQQDDVQDDVEQAERERNRCHQGEQNGGLVDDGQGQRNWCQ
jgi:hypothetical protein